MSHSIVQEDKENRKEKAKRNFNSNSSVQPRSETDNKNKLTPKSSKKKEKVNLEPWKIKEPKPVHHPPAPGTSQLIHVNKKNQKNLRFQIRNLTRLLNKPDLNENIRKSKEEELSNLKISLAIKNSLDKNKKIDSKYKHIKFFEYRKIIRRLAQLRKSLSLVQAGQTSKMTEEERAIREEIILNEKDLEYVTHFPSGRKYISLFKTVRKSERKNIQGEGEAEGEEDKDEDKDNTDEDKDKDKDNDKDKEHNQNLIEIEKIRKEIAAKLKNNKNSLNTINSHTDATIHPLSSHNNNNNKSFSDSKNHDSDPSKPQNLNKNKEALKKLKKKTPEQKKAEDNFFISDSDDEPKGVNNNNNNNSTNTMDEEFLPGTKDNQNEDNDTSINIRTDGKVKVKRKRQEEKEKEKEKEKDHKINKKDSVTNNEIRSDSLKKSKKSKT